MQLELVNMFTADDLLYYIILKLLQFVTFLLMSA